MDRRPKFHDHRDALSDHRRFSILYRLLSDIIRPKIETIVEHEQASASSTEQLRVALRIIKGLIKDSVPDGTTNLPKEDIRLAGTRIEKLLRENKNLVLEDELDSLSRNIARSVINSWLTELEANYDLGMNLDARLTPANVETGFIAKAMQPYHVPHFEDIVSQSMISLGTMLVSRGSEGSWVSLPFGMRMSAQKQVQYYAGSGNTSSLQHCSS